MIRGWQGARNRLSEDLPLRAGLLAGIAGAVLSLALRGVVPGRYLGDPLPLALAFTGILRGFAYFDWRAPLAHGAFAASLGASAGLFVRMSSAGRVFPDGAARAGRIAGILSVIVVALLEVDALSVALSSFAGRLIGRVRRSRTEQTMTPRRLVEQNGFALRIGLVLVAGLAWGSSVVVHRMGILEAPPLTFLVLRLAVATVAFVVALALIQGRLPSRGRTRWDIALVGVTATGVPLVAGTFALLVMSAGMLAIFLSLAPLLTAVMAHFWLTDERLSLRRAAGLTVALGGVALLPAYLMPLASGLFGMTILGEVVTLPLLAGGGLVLSGVYLGSR